MVEHHRAMLNEVIRQHQQKHHDMYIRLRGNLIEVRVGAANSYKKQVLRAKVVLEDNPETPNLYYDFKIVYFNTRITITDAFWATNVLLEILLEMTTRLNQMYRRPE